MVYRTSALTRHVARVHRSRVIVAIGIVGEVGFGLRHWLLNKHLQRIERAETQQLERDILAERRLTAKERWLLGIVAKIVFPRQLTPDQYSAALPKLAGLKPINIAIVRAPGTDIYGLQLVELFTKAKIMGRLIWLSRDSQQLGVMTYVANDDGKKLASVLHGLGIGSGELGGGVLPVGLESVPKTENCLIVGENDAAFQGMPGQPGEGLDEHDRPVPNPQ